MTIRAVTVVLGGQNPDNSYKVVSNEHTSSAAGTGGVSIAWDDTAITNRGQFLEAVRIAAQRVTGDFKP